MNKLVLYFLLLFAVLNYSLSADIIISIRNFEVVSALSPKTEPILSCDLLAKLDNSVVELTLLNVDIIQSDVAFIRNIEIGVPDSEGWQKVVWGLEVGIPHNMSFEVVVSQDGEIGYRSLPPLLNFSGYDVDIYSSYGGADKINPPIDLSHWNGSMHYQFYFRVKGNYDTSALFTAAPYLDSITFTNPNMSYIWTGTGVDITGRPPKKLVLDNPYQITLLYDEPLDNPFIRDWMIFHFSGDIRYKIEIVSNPYWLDYKPLMKLKHPVGGEKFAPCEEVLIEWSGHNPEFMVRLQYSTDNKQSWKSIATVSGKDTAYLWVVPNTISDSCYIRINQSFTRKSNKLLVYDSARIISSSFNKLSTKVLTTSNIGNIVEWDLFSADTASVLTSLSFLGNDGLNSAIYLRDDRFVFLDHKNKKLCYVNSGINVVDKEVPLNSFYSSSLGSLLKDAKDRFILICPQRHYGNIAVFLDTAGNYITSLSEDMPITNMYLSDSEDKLYYSLLDNSIKSIALSGFPNIVGSEKYDFAKLFNIIETFSVSNNGEQIALGIRNVKSTGSREYFGDNMVYDKPSGKVFQNIQVNRRNSLSIDFNPTGNLLIIGNPVTPQISIEDLTGGSNTAQIQQVFDTLLGLTVSHSGNGLVAYSYGDTNCMYISFALPEQAENLEAFSIHRPQIVLSDSSLNKMRDLLIGTSDSVTFVLQLCNKGDVRAILETGYFLDLNIHFSLDYGKMIFPLVIESGECVDLSIIVSPKDTGLLSNKLRFVSCDYNYEYPFSFKSINRKLTNLVADTINFGEVCLLERDTMRLELFQNDDSVDVLINEIYSYSLDFGVSYFSRDTILHPGDKYLVEIYYNPHSSGEHIAEFVVVYCGQRNVFKHIYCKGIGIGTYLSLSHYYLPFMSAIPERSILVTNTGDSELYIDSVDISPSGYYSCITQLPINIGIGESLELLIRCIDVDSIVSADMRVLAKPCAISQVVKIVPYIGTANLTIPLVETIPQNSSCYIPVMLSHSENYPYMGERFLDFTISINASLFVPRYGESNYGSVKLQFDTIISGKRLIGVRFTGDITSNNAELLRLYGMAALGNVDTSSISFDTSSLFFGKSIKTVATDGFFRLIDFCPGRFLSNGSLFMSLGKISPNPATDFVDIEYEMIGVPQKEIYLEIYDRVGSLLLQKLIDTDSGLHSVRIDISGYTSGVYYFRINYGYNTTDFEVIIVI